jgi:c-di-GMP-related signal transduction protein
MTDTMQDAAALSLIAMTSYLGRQPILDRENRLVAYELLFRPSGTDRAVPDDDAPLDTTRATADILVETLGELGLDSVLGGATGYVNTARDWLMNEMLTLLPPAHFVIEIVRGVQDDARVAQRIAQLSQAGYRFALDDLRENADAHGAIFDAASVVKLDASRWRTRALAPFVAAMHRAGKQVVAGKVETPEVYQWAREAGCDLFQGYYFAHPHLLAVRRIPPLRHALVKLLVLLAAEPDLPSIEDEVKRNPVLAMQVLRVASAADHPLPQRQLRIGDALRIVGTGWLRRWTLLALYTDGQAHTLASDALVQLVGTRARLMELAARRLRPHDSEFHDNAFMTGMTSLLPAVLARNPAQLFDELHLAAPVRDAIQTRHGELGQLLGCAEASEAASTEDGLDDLCAPLAPLTPAAIRLLAAAAASWMADHTRG